MLQKSSLVSPIAAAYLIISASLIHLPLLGQTPPGFPDSSVLPVPSQENSSNLITNNPFVPKNQGPLNPPKNPPSGPQSASNKPQILQKYIAFKSIAIINKKKYFSIFNKRTNQSFWIPENETVENFRVSNYNLSDNTITISDGINTEVIPIMTANETPLNVATAAAPPKNQNANEPQIPGANATKPNNKPKAPARRRVIPVKR